MKFALDNLKEKQIKICLILYFFFKTATIMMVNVSSKLLQIYPK